MWARLEGEVKTLINELIELVYFMRGAISYDDMLHRTYVERQLVSEFLNTRLEAEGKKMNPNY